MGKKKKKKLPYKIVQDLKVGEGKVIVMTKKGNRFTVKGEVIELPNGKKYLQTRSISCSFGPGTKVEVEEWEPKQKL
ncbi:MAG: hypothetical protein COY72_01085 [Candidatus Nealsonbacteria bacterium CG_4_10_14_0_8_um_filter_35_10]|uniref:Uncharacterized protein n=1 Tax=Candidatus Nealsonbacteria bacterium CG_4_10_14_0_8_um_filter_35_10 TaxID=1974683 RepID=A0A2M7R916_9BACT|nr:MAG: hypothetical protein COY72_01085 [Candidatus Nealsonbacteria bacterium CG_4_10_14_0_8_um_filter_35_10]